jgi:hypothetical protein
MIRRWVGIAVIDARKRFRRPKGHAETPVLLETLGRLHRGPLDAKTVAA